jgi:putative transcriptional regulator
MRSSISNCRRILFVLLVGALGAVLHAPTIQAETHGARTSVAKGMLLIAHPSMEDPNFRHTVVLLLDHGQEGTLGIILNRPTDIPLSQALPDLAALKGTAHRLFVGGPVATDQMTMLARLPEPLPEIRQVFDDVYVGGTPAMLERLITQPKPLESFRVFAGMAGWAPGQLDAELREGAWAALTPDAAEIFAKDPSVLWRDSLRRLQVPQVISNEPHARRIAVPH